MSTASSVPVGFGDAFLETTFIGAFLLFALYGCTLGQTVHYYSRYKKDDLELKILVAILLVIDSAKVAAGADILYYYIVTNHQDPYSIGGLPSAYTIIAILGMITVLISQCFYLRTIHSVWTRRRKTYRVAVVIPGHYWDWVCSHFLLWTLFSLITIDSLATGIVWITELNLHNVDTDALKGISARTGVVQLATNIATDLYITVALSWILHDFHSAVETRGLLRSHDSNLGAIVSRLFAYSASRGALLLVLQVIEITINLLDDEHQTYLTNIVWLPQSTVYCNSVLAALNVRQHVRESSTAPSLFSWSTRRSQSTI
ncbi:hypothetical protein DAEQUDRAFT_813340 [Daedalea quercina L-15889]|uniref:DUF6534 domain-containing protein n=1 Tax=Daedalea quercina L-15889 TaxID=1314783 RepID=A0A165NBR1_9APHY|nr:hypothetical protein DAEQUDRAFT_813340 [Daedalea quercina L-15889]